MSQSNDHQRVSTTEEDFNNQGKGRLILQIEGSVSPELPQCSCSDPINRVTKVAKKEPMHGPRSLGSPLSRLLCLLTLSEAEINADSLV